MTSSCTFTTPVGRFVGGDLFTPRDEDMFGKPLTTQKGEPRVEYVIQVAFPKSDPAISSIWQQIYNVAKEGFPSLFASGQPPAGFSFKMVDGDSTIPDQRGRKPVEKEGYAGHLVLTFKSSFAAKVYDQHVNPILDPKTIKRGDYIRVNAICKSNGSVSKPGVYLNHTMVQLCGYGEEISVGPDAHQVFAETAQLPVGASVTPVAPAHLPSNGAPAAGTAFAPPVTAPPPVAAPPAMPQLGAPVPHLGFGMPQNITAPAPPPPPPPVAKQTKPGAPSYEALVQAGWTEQHMRQAGYID